MRVDALAAFAYLLGPLSGERRTCVYALVYDTDLSSFVAACY
jgi:hypothetical protein